jgi:hypothetical protein
MRRDRRRSARIWLHACQGNAGDRFYVDGTTEFLFPKIYDFKVDQIHIALAHPLRAGDLEFFQKYPPPPTLPDPPLVDPANFDLEMLVEENGDIAPENGNTIVANDNLGQGDWYEITSPVKVDGVDNSGCKNFSPALLPTGDGQVLEMATDYFAENDCRSYYATGPLTPR